MKLRLFVLDGAECCKVRLLDSHVQYADSSSGDGSEGMVSTNVWTLANHECRMCTLEAFHEACRRGYLTCTVHDMSRQNLFDGQHDFAQMSSLHTNIAADSTIADAGA